MPDKSPLQRGTIEWDHLSEPHKQILRRLGLGGTSVRQIIADSALVTSEDVEDIIGAKVLGGAGLTSTYDDPAGTTTIGIAAAGVVAGMLAADSVTDANIGNRTALEDTVPPNPVTPQQNTVILSYVVNRLREIMGTAHWWNNPAASIATMLAALNALPAMAPIDGNLTYWDGGDLGNIEVSDGLEVYDTGGGQLGIRVTGVPLTTVEKDLGTSACATGGTFDITGLSGLTVGRPVMISQATGPYTGKGSMEDEAEMDLVVATGYVFSATTIRVYWNVLRGPIVGNVKFNYFVG